LDPAAVSTISVATDRPRGITNRNQPLLIFHMDPTNTIGCARKSFICSVVSFRVDYEPNLGCEPVLDHSAVSTISVATDRPKGITNRNQPPLIFHMDPTNTIVCARKSFIGFLAKLEFGISVEV
jgi:hypothetical protein